MGITAGPSYTTDQGFVLSPIYLNIGSVTIQATEDSQPLGAIFNIFGYKSYQDRLSGNQPINLPYSLSVIQTTIDYKDAFRQSVFGLAYDIIAARWQSAGYTTENVLEPGQPLPKQYIYDSSGLDIDGNPPPA